MARGSRNSGVGGSHNLDGRHRGSGAGRPHGARGHAAQELKLGPRGVWVGGTRLWTRAPEILMYVPGNF